MSANRVLKDSPHTTRVGVAILISLQFSFVGTLANAIERNWRLGTISGRSRDNLPNPKASDGNPYVPKTLPRLAICLTCFNFSQKDHGHKSGGH